MKSSGGGTDTCRQTLVLRRLSLPGVPYCYSGQTDEVA